jgi:NADH-quinone oxidoreductase subunit M
MFKRVAFGEIANDKVRGMSDLNSREFFIMGVMAIAVLYMGIYPKPFTDVMHVSVEALLQHVSISKL